MMDVWFNGIMPESRSLALTILSIELEFDFSDWIKVSIDQKSIIEVLPYNEIESSNVINTVITIIFINRNGQVGNCNIVETNSFDFWINKTVIFKISKNTNNTFNFISKISVSISLEKGNIW